VFLLAATLPDHKLVTIASEDSFHLGVLSSRIHLCWASATGGKLVDRPVYIKSVCFDSFPFPDATPQQQTRIRQLGENLDDHRKARQALHTSLTITGMYNVLDAIRSSRVLTEKEQAIHQQGLVTVLGKIHWDLDCAVADAYGWPVDMSDDEILTRLVALHVERVREEREGHVRWLRPEYQTQTKEEGQRQSALHFGETSKHAPVGVGTNAKEFHVDTTLPWPTEPLDQVQSVRSAVEFLRESSQAITADRVCAQLTRASKKRIDGILRALRALGLDIVP